jgi:chorismate mutase/prephenate dehydratase
VATSIEDCRGNTTRFVVIGKEMPAASGNDLTSAAFTIRRDQSGALFHLLEPFARHNVNLTAVQSRPMKGKPWEYVFFIDMEGHESEENVGKALDEAASYAHSHKILGAFPRAARPRGRQLGRRDQ